jgi:hypothetical protein
MHWQNEPGKFQYPVAPAGIVAGEMTRSTAAKVVSFNRAI